MNMVVVKIKTTTGLYALAIPAARVHHIEWRTVEEETPCDAWPGLDMAEGTSPLVLTLREGPHHVRPVWQVESLRHVDPRHLYPIPKILAGWATRLGVRAFLWTEEWLVPIVER